MAITVKLKYVRHSPRKLRPVLSMFAGKNLETSIIRTGLMSQNSAQSLNKALKSAKAAAEEKQFDTSTMTIAELFATDGPKIKRIRANARGRTNKFVKHVAHLVVVLKEGSVAKVATAAKPKTEVATTVRKRK